MQTAAQTAAAHRPWQTIGILAFTQIVSWGSLYYAFSLFAPQVQQTLGWRAEIVYGAFSWSLLISGFAATPIGALIDRIGGRAVMGAGSLISGVGLIVLSRCDSVAMYFAAWTLLGLAMAMTMYEAAFATINLEFGMNARQAISTLTLFGGFASTLFWPLTAKLATLMDWRGTMLLYGLVHIVLCLPAHLLLRRHVPHDAASPAAARGGHTLREAVAHPAFWKLALAFSANSFIFSSLSVHLIPLLGQYGHAAALAVVLASAIGPMQVAGRIGERMFGQNLAPATVGNLTFIALPLALSVLLAFGVHQWAAALFCGLYGLGNGVLTIVRGTLPLALFGRANYGAISGALAGPTLVARAAGPLAMAALSQRFHEPNVLMAILLGVALVSLAAYLAATHTRTGVATPAGATQAR